MTNNLYFLPQVPKSLLLQMLGEESVTKFVIQEIVSSTMTDYTKKARLASLLLQLKKP